jgi:hypothetical protein
MAPPASVGAADGARARTATVAAQLMAGDNVILVSGASLLALAGPD